MTARLELALDLLKPEQWRRFEQFASPFLVNEFPGLIDMAAPAGDGGRDAEVFALKDDPTLYFQYSVRPDWETKIRETVKRLNQTFPGAQLLVYVSPKRIGADADELKAELRKNHRLHLEIRDRSYFTVRFGQSRSTEIASEELAQEIVDPVLPSQLAPQGKAQALNSSETRAAHLFLMLQLKDDTGEKGLTKLSFEAVVRSILASTDADHRMGRKELMGQVKAILAGHAEQHIEELTSSALVRLVRREMIRSYPKEDSFCLSFEEAKKMRERLAGCALEAQVLDQAIEDAASEILGNEESTPKDIEKIRLRVRRVLESCLYLRAEAFAQAVLKGRVSDFALDHLHELVLKDLSSTPAAKGSHEGNPGLLQETIARVLNNNSTPDYEYLKGLADAYTLMAFLSLTPDVQTAMQKIFSYGEIWLDTTIILPMLAEELLEDSQGRIQTILGLTRQAGNDLFTTTGVLEELASHIRRAITYTHVPSSRWEGSIPFIFEAYVRAGRDPNAFTSWAENFIGDVRPVEDLGAYLEERFGIRTHDLTEEVESADITLRSTLDNIWQEWHEMRRTRHAQLQHARELDPLTVLRLAKHDTESYLGVVQRRTTETSSPLGYKSWWLTFDSYATRVEEALRKHDIQPPASPVMSIDFLSQYLSLGPVRARVSIHEIRRLPVAIEPRLVAFLTPELLEQAKQIRLSLAGLPERVISRRVRDHLDAERRKRGPISERGTHTFFDEISDLELQTGGTVSSDGE